MSTLYNEHWDFESSVDFSNKIPQEFYDPRTQLKPKELLELTEDIINLYTHSSGLLHLSEKELSEAQARIERASWQWRSGWCHYLADSLKYWLSRAGSGGVEAPRFDPMFLIATVRVHATDPQSKNGVLDDILYHVWVVVPDYKRTADLGVTPEFDLPKNMVYLDALGEHTAEDVESDILDYLEEKARECEMDNDAIDELYEDAEDDEDDEDYED